ncbi:universal stress protein [Dyadobacter psychrotolerans]|uniref:Universal stress protein n=1 Tax=Dyadobacter psychrotolerans TaxID=2541721 RepID=A0A4R5DTX6_9BACT|nr:universal stress protein [Dyadobacter psychrotolerans]TDE17986.1 universal stress protein [Dyadobacter psychrotolerans]
MKKIIVAIDGLKFSRSAAEYAALVTRKANGHLVGVFLEDFTYHSFSMYSLIPDQGLYDDMISKSEAEDKKARAQAVTDFQEICRLAKIEYSVHREENFARKHLLHESIYADLLVIDKTETMSNNEEEVPSDFMRELLINVECPIMVVPRHFEEFERVIMLYDGEPSSVFAIKMFSSVFQYLHKPVEVLSVKSSEENLHLPDNRLMKEFMKRHYPKATYTVLHGAPELEIVEHLKNKHQDALIVLGAYRRNIVSRWFRSSMADLLMHELKSPLFIAHK